VHVSSAFYRQWWFYFACLLAFAAIVYSVFRYRMQRILEMERLRTTISGDLHDEVGASLTSISIFSEMAKKSVAPLSKEAQYLERIGERSRESIEKMSDIIWSINPNNDSLQQMLIRMKNYTSEVSEAKDITVYWKEEGNLISAGLSIEQRKNFYLFFKEVVNNTIKHAAAKNIWIELLVFQNIILLNLKDDGKGFNTDAVSQGQGLKSMYRRAGILQGKIKISSEQDKGTTVQLEFVY
jgi:signal transduction histidine kinase